MDAMVTARLPQEKKARGNEILASLGTTPSKLIGELYDFIIAEERVPDMSVSRNGIATDDDRKRAFKELVSTTVLPVPPSFWEQAKSDDDVLTTALEDKYGSLT